MPTLSDEPTLTVLRRLQAGDTRARESLVARYLPRLTRWAHGRLPAGARDLSDRHDLVQVTLVRVLSHLQDFEHSGGGSLLGYLQQALLNVLRNEIRRSRRRGEHGELPELPAASTTASPTAVRRHDRCYGVRSAARACGSIVASQRRYIAADGCRPSPTSMSA
jgi:DNA-directed RNA polymerase specialized sigma24 family protein